MMDLFGGGPKLHQRSLSAPSLDALVDAAMQQLDTSPTTVLELRSLEDAVSQSLRRTLEAAQREAAAAVEAGVLSRAAGAGGRAGGSGNAGASGSRRQYGSDSGEVRGLGQTAASGSSSTMPSSPP